MPAGVQLYRGRGRRLDGSGDLGTRALSPVDDFRLDADQGALRRKGAGQARDIEQVGQADLMHTVAVAAQEPVHVIAQEGAKGAGRGLQLSRIDHDQVSVLGDGAGQGETQGSSVEQGNPRFRRVMSGQMFYNVNTETLIAEQRIADTENQGGAHWVGVAGYDAKRLADMCLGIPMQIMEIDQFLARCTAKGVERDVSLFMLQHETLSPGDFVVVHVGYAIQKVSPEQAATAWDLYDEMISKAEAIEGVRDA